MDPRKLKETYYYFGNFYHREQLLRFKCCKVPMNIYIEKVYPYNWKLKMFMWSVMVDNMPMKMFYKRGEYSFYRLNNSNRYEYWRNANTLYTSPLSFKMLSISSNSSIKDMTVEPSIVYIEMIPTTHINILSHPIHVEKEFIE